MSRVQLALNVADLDASIEFYTKLFGSPPAKVREGYANFAIADPPLKLVLFAGAGEPGSLNHLGVEVDSSEEVMAATSRAQRRGAADGRAGVDNVLLRGARQGVGAGSGQRVGVLQGLGRRTGAQPG